LGEGGQRRKGGFLLDRRSDVCAWWVELYGTAGRSNERGMVPLASPSFGLGGAFSLI
jgi:hypothetical protein